MVAFATEVGVSSGSAGTGPLVKGTDTYSHKINNV